MVVRYVLLAAVFLAVSLPGGRSHAQNGTVLAPPVELSDREKIEQCLIAVSNAKSDPRACVGVVADPCLEGVSNGAHRPAVECMQRETVIWATRLDASVKDLATLLGAGAPEAMADIHETWKLYRQKRCSFGRVLYPESDFATVWQATCVLEETGRRATEIGAILKEARGRGG